ncbi:reverse transcriptase domain-containing protein [Tanacetum coccineum]
MAKDDEEKTAFHTSQFILLYKEPSGLKNMGVHLPVTGRERDRWANGPQPEVYVDDLVKSAHRRFELVADNRFELRNGVLYRRSFLQPCAPVASDPIPGIHVLCEIHAGSCGMHSGPRSVVARALRSGYYWPTMHRDARNMIQKCNDYQVHRPIPRQPQQELTPITSPWPFHKWGIDIAGPFPVAAGGCKNSLSCLYTTLTIMDLAKAVATIKGESGDNRLYRANNASLAEDTGKLGPKWEGPYEVTEALGKGAYKLRDMDGRELPRTWNICNLTKCYL